MDFGLKRCQTVKYYRTGNARQTSHSTFAVNVSYKNILANIVVVGQLHIVKHCSVFTECECMYAQKRQ